MSFDIALSGIQAINEQLDTVSNNIANSGTYGFKAGRANFSSLVAGSQVAGTTIGSTTQNIGLSGGVLNTGRDLDVSINGRGFFVTKTGAGAIQYTRVGIFDTSDTGQLIDSSGRLVQGYPITPPATTLGALGNISIPTGQIPAVATTKVAFTANMSADWVPPTATFGAANAAAITPTNPPDPSTYSYSKSTKIYDTLGTEHTLTQYYGAGATAGDVNVNYVVDGYDTNLSTVLSFNPANGQLTNVSGSTATPPLIEGLVIPAPPAVPVPSGASFTPTINIDYTGTTYFAGQPTVSTNQPDGYASGVFSKATIGSDGSIIAKYSNGQNQTIGKLAIATFPDEGALAAVDNTSWEQSATSGNPLYGQPGDGLAGNLNTTSLEQSNVDITSELVGMMTSQRNYQANSKVIQTESTMLQSLMQAI